MNEIIYEDINNIIKKEKKWSEFLNKKTILITGSTGMLGQYIVYTLLTLQDAIDFEIILLVRKKEKALKLFSDFKLDKVQILEQDINFEINISQKIDYIIHAASLASPQYYSVSPVDVILPNVLGSYNMLELAKNKNCNKFLFFSSSEIYGKVDSKVNYNENEVGKIDSLDVRNCYSISKRMGENLCISFHKQYDLPVNIVRIFHTYGPTMDIENDKRAFSEFVKNIVYSENIVIKGSGEAKRPFCYISDATLAFFKILFYGKSGECYNMGNENEYLSIKELADILVKLRPNKKIKVKYENTKKGIFYKKEENSVTLSSKKLNKLNWKAQINVKEGFNRTIKSFELEKKL